MFRIHRCISFFVFFTRFGGREGGVWERMVSFLSFFLSFFLNTVFSTKLLEMQVLHKMRVHEEVGRSYYLCSVTLHPRKLETRYY